MRRILFVDDEPQVLRALQNLMRRQRHRWDMHFASSGADALAAFENGLFDVVVTDMNMPGMDGVALLTRVRELYPTTARIVLSGYADPRTQERALAIAHEFLSKPCDSRTLEDAIQRMCER